MIIGGHVKIFGSIALDLAPALVGSLILDPISGMLLAFIGHLLSALLSGFPLTIAVHLIIGLMMALTLYIFGRIRHINKKNVARIIVSDITTFIFNVFIAQLPLIPLLGIPTLLSLTPMLIIASAINIAVAELVYHALPLTVVQKIVSQ